MVFTVIAGVQYRIREDAGLDPIYAPTWIAVGTTVGLWVFVLGLAALGVTAVVAKCLPRV